MPPHSTPPSDREWNKRQPLAPAARGIDASDVAAKPQSIYGSRRASLILDIIVVGCGLGGLGAAFCLMQAGHRVTIVESASVIGEVGAGIQVSPNSSRLLRRWGLGKHLEEIAVKPEGIAFRRYNTGERVGFTTWGEVIEGEYGAPYCHIHRADFHKLLYDLVAPHITIRLGSTVVGCDPDPVAPSITLKSGEVMKADLIVGADGVKSDIQPVVTGKRTPAEATGDAAYRATIPASLMMQDPELREFIEHPQMTAWMAPGRHLMAYPIVRLSPFFQGLYSVCCLCRGRSRSIISSYCIRTTGQWNPGLQREVQKR
jgi:salicylate hydroxylase